MVINTEPTTREGAEDESLRVLSPKWEICNPCPLSKTRVSVCEVLEKNVRAAAHMNACKFDRTPKTHTISSQIKSQHEMWKLTESSLPNEDVLAISSC